MEGFCKALNTQDDLLLALKSLCSQHIPSPDPTAPYSPHHCFQSDNKSLDLISESAGYTYDSASLACISVNFCAMPSRGGCARNAVCAWSASTGVACTCRPGFLGNGSVFCQSQTPPTCFCTDAYQQCNSNSQCVCIAGYAIQGGVCTAINACLTNNGGCPTTSVCTSTGPSTASVR